MARHPPHPVLGVQDMTWPELVLVIFVSGLIFYLIRRQRVR